MPPEQEQPQNNSSTRSEEEAADRYPQVLYHEHSSEPATTEEDPITVSATITSYPQDLYQPTENTDLHKPPSIRAVHRKRQQGKSVELHQPDESTENETPKPDNQHKSAIGATQPLQTQPSATLEVPKTKTIPPATTRNPSRFTWSGLTTAPLGATPPATTSEVRSKLNPFQKLAQVHAVSMGADGVIAVALAGSIFFSISPDAARSRIILYLLLTMTPFAVVTPFLGPIIDRIPGGHRAMIILTTIGRGVIAYFMIKHLDTLLLFPEALTLLVLQKAYTVAKSSIVSHYVQTTSKLVEANSRLALLSSLASLLGAGIGAILVWIEGSSWAAAGALIGYGFAALLATRLPKTSRSSKTFNTKHSSGKTETSDSSTASSKETAIVNSARMSTRSTRHSKPDHHSRLQKHLTKKRMKKQRKLKEYSTAILLAIPAMAVLRAAVGLVTFLLAFELRGGPQQLDVSEAGSALGAAVAATHNINIDTYTNLILDSSAPPPWHFGVVALAAGLSALVGVRGAPFLRRYVNEEMIMLLSLLTGFGASLLAASLGGLAGLAILAAGISIASTAGKLAFDTLVQRDLPEIDHGRLFAKFEARLQIAWVIGAFVPVAVPVLIPLSAQAGTLVVASTLGFATASFIWVCRSTLVPRSYRKA